MPTTTTYDATDRFIGKCDHCVRPVAVEVAGYFGDYMRSACPDCTTTIKLERVYGTLSVHIDCDASCLTAIGPKCVCACGGANHGAGVLRVRGEALASLIAKFRRTDRNRAAGAAKRAAKAAEKRAAKAAAEQAAKDAFLKVNADVVEWIANNRANGFANDLGYWLNRKGTLTDPQLAAARRWIVRDARVAAERATEALTATAAPLGRQLVTGDVVSTKVQDGLYGIQYKMLVKCDGYKVWSTIPSAILPNDHSDLRGKRVSFTANLSLSRNNPDPSFAIANRPTQAIVLADAIAGSSMD